MPSADTRTVLCVCCASWFRVPEAAMVLTCPCCYKRVRVEDITIDTVDHRHRLETCGVLRVRRRAVLNAGELRVGAAIIVEDGGRVQTRIASSFKLQLHARAQWAGDCEAAYLTIDPGAIVESGRFTITPPAQLAPPTSGALEIITRPNPALIARPA
ncbi:MAG: polymer-forming cytoskeletal protein [Phycisphaerales bacterium]|nr:polymer-forming cytoskeletal protein [Phycisphaerales bacterium]